MMLAWLIVLALVVLTVGIHYEVLRLLAAHIDEMELPFRVRVRMVLVMLVIIATHVSEILLFALGLFLAATVAGAGGLAGVAGVSLAGGFQDFVYFSFVSYTTLGFGEIYPTQGLRIISGVEALTGLLMITWSASFTFLYMEKFWRLGHGGDGGEAE